MFCRRKKIAISSQYVLWLLVIVSHVGVITTRLGFYLEKVVYVKECATYIITRQIYLRQYKQIKYTQFLTTNHDFVLRFGIRVSVKFKASVRVRVRVGVRVRVRVRVRVEVRFRVRVRVGLGLGLGFGLGLGLALV